MLRKGSFIFLALAIVLASAAAFAAHKWIQRQGAVAAASRIAMTPVVVASRDLPAGLALSAGDLKVTRWPQAGLPQGSFNSVNVLSGRVLKTAASQGEPLLSGKLAAKGLRGGLSAVLPQGYRAMTVHVDEVIGVGGFVQPGDLVDVLATVAKGPYQKDPITRTVLQGVTVLTVGQNVEQDKDAKKPKRDKSKVVTLQLTPLQAETLALSANEGKLLLALRSNSDRRETDSPGVRLTSLLPVTTNEQGETAQVTEKRPTVEIIKGVLRLTSDSLGAGKPSGKERTTQVAKAAEGGGGGVGGTGDVPCFLNKPSKK
ncbi:MAG: Flp pilus assembly protein CpaB [Pseudomonadota bacterium]